MELRWEEVSSPLGVTLRLAALSAQSLSASSVTQPDPGTTKSAPFSLQAFQIRAPTARYGFQWLPRSYPDNPSVCPHYPPKEYAGGLHCQKQEAA